MNTKSFNGMWKIPEVYLCKILAQIFALWMRYSLECNVLCQIIPRESATYSIRYVSGVRVEYDETFHECASIFSRAAGE